AQGEAMKYLCLAYGAAEDWKKLNRSEQETLLAQDDFLRSRGDVVAALGSAATTVRAWYGDPVTTTAVFSSSTLPLVGFGIIEAADLEEAIRLVAPTPCARAKGFVEVRPIVTINM
ncbi:MAG: YciI family protein, partial [Candidatus Cybelea sp.]